MAADNGYYYRLGLGKALKVPQCNKNISKALQSMGLGTDPLGIAKQMRMDTIRSRAFCLSVCCIKELKIEGAINLAVVFYACEDWFFFTQLSVPTHAQLQRHRLKFI